MSEPEQHNVLVITLGGAPGVVTETVFALLDEKPSWIPHEIHLVTTTFGANDWHDPSGRPMSELRAVFDYFGAPFVAPSLLVPTDKAGKPITDIRTEDENIPFANELTWLVKEIKERKNTRLHMSMAGGRKTMSSYSHAAMQYFAEENDELTHTLVEPKALEYHKQFYWPFQSQQEIEPELLASRAKIALVQSPFVSLRPLIERIPFAKNNFDHWTLRERLQARLHEFAPPLRLGLSKCTVESGEAVIQLGAQEFALYRVLATALLESWPGVGPDGLGDGHAGWLLFEDFGHRKTRAVQSFLMFYRECTGNNEDPVFAAGDHDHLTTRFRSIRTDLKKKLRIGLPAYLRRRLIWDSVSEGQIRRHGLLLKPHEIEIVES